LNILIGGDIVPTKSNLNLFSQGDVTALFGEELLSVLKAADMRIFNLETPLTDINSPIRKCGPNLIASTKSVKGIKELNPTLLTLANNHILDQGVLGLKSTLQVLTQNNIPFVGVGDNLFEARQPYILTHEKIKIGVYACAENEFSIATESLPGANPFDPLEALDDIQILKEKCDYVIVLYHGGKEHYRYPSPNLQKVCRKIAEKGADLVVCQHSHCIGCIEEHGGSTIVYGQGNFLFDEYENEFWNNSLIINVIINNGLKLEYLPIVKQGKGVRLATGQEAKEILSAFHHRSDEILINGFVEQQYKSFAQDQITYYLRNFSGLGKWINRIDRRIFNNFLIKKKYNKEKLLAIQNFIECEAHREIVLKGLQTKEN
jgi:poly-gamma-glutamate capsule biosynthesis protein CapA/YwtB (metallophosphatase superfamily)